MGILLETVGIGGHQEFEGQKQKYFCLRTKFHQGV